MTPVSRRLASALGWCCLLALLAAWFMLAVIGDRVWWTVPLLFGPRWLLAAPCLGLIPWLLVDIRRALLPAVAALGIAVFAVIGWHVGLHRDHTGGIPFRVLELNADGNYARPDDLAAELREPRADLAIVAECDAAMAQALATANGFRIQVSGNLCLLSRGAIAEWHERSEDDMVQESGGGAVVRAIVETPAGPVRVGLVHLATPRNALDNYFSLSALLRQGPTTRANMTERARESDLARGWILSGPQLPTIIAGDFNLPVESAIYRRYWGDLRNAFSRAGFGTGYTKHTRYWGARIDHILTTADIGTQAANIGRDVGSDHRPLVADLLLPTGQRTSTAR